MDREEAREQRTAARSKERSGSEAGTVIPDGMDPITFEVLANAFYSVVQEMGIMLEKVAVSTVVSEGRDYCGSVCTSAGEIAARGAQDLPLLGGTAGSRLEGLLACMSPEDFHEGDIFLHNDPFLGGTHAQDISAIMPVFWEGSHIAFVHVACHWPDMGGPLQGSFNSEATSTYQEALLIPPIHIVRRGVIDEEVLRLILRNLRVPEMIRGDLQAMIEACRTGEERLHHLVQRYDPDLIVSEMEGLISYSESLLRQEFSELADGKYSWTDYIDHDPLGDPDRFVNVALDIVIEGDKAVYDFSRSSDLAKGPINSPPSATQSAAIVGTKGVFPHIPLNSGFNRAIEFVIPEGKVVSAEFPAPVSGHGNNVGEKIVACLQGCYLQMLPERAMACPSNLVNVTLGGFDERRGESSEFVMYLWLGGGWGARPGKKDNHTALDPLSSGSRAQSMEVLERVNPIFFEKGYSLIPDSEGSGRHRGGFGVGWIAHMTDARDVLLSTMGDRAKSPVWGFAGGQSAMGNSISYGFDEDTQNIGMMRAGFRIEPGVPFEYIQGGGGGWGWADERPIEWVADDVMAGLVSVERAASVYGVVFEEVDAELLKYVVDVEGSTEIRTRMKENRRYENDAD